MFVNRFIDDEAGESGLVGGAGTDGGEPRLDALPNYAAREGGSGAIEHAADLVRVVLFLIDKRRKELVALNP